MLLKYFTIAGIGRKKKKNNFHISSLKFVAMNYGLFYDFGHINFDFNCHCHYRTFSPILSARKNKCGKMLVK